MKLHPLIPELLKIARAASAAIMQVYSRDDHGIQVKQDDSPLTEADLAAHHIIREGLSRLTPEYPQLSEEDSSIPYQQRRDWSRYWLIDPLDGTKEFIHRNDEFSVNIALIHNRQPVLGVICLPVSGICYYGGTGIGAWKQQPGLQPDRIATRSYRQPLRVLASRRHKNDREQPLLDRLQQQFGELQIAKYGSSLKMCVIAEGSADLYPRRYPTCEWDTAAAQAIVEAAGGQILGPDMQPLTYNKQNLLNPDFYVIGDSSFPVSLLEPRD